VPRLDEIRAALAKVPDPLALLQALFAFSPVGLQVYQADGRSLVVNEAFIRLFGSAPPPEYNVLEDSIAERTGILALIHRAFAGEVVKTPAIWYDPRQLTQIKVEEGRRVAITATFFPLFDREGKVAYVAIAFTDVTAETRARERSELLARAGEVLGDTLDVARVADAVARALVPLFADVCSVMFQRPDGDFERAAVASSCAEVEARLRADRASPLADLAAEVIQEACGRGEALLFADYLGLVERRVAAGHPYLELTRAIAPRSVIVAPLLARGRALGAIFAGTIGPEGRVYEEDDVRLAAELATRAALAIDSARHYQREVEAVRVRDDFLSVASHELRTPLTTLALHADSIGAAIQKQGLDPGGTLAARVDKIRRQIHRLELLIQTLLNVTRLAEKEPRPDRQRMDLAELARDVIDRFSDEAAVAGSALELLAPAPVWGEWDAFHLDQVLTNLLTNAIKYGAGKPVRVAVERLPGAASVRVSDGGIGVAPADQARIFERFERAASPRHYGGLGLGLWLARQLVAGHGGTVTVTSDAGEGATFEVRLPAG
jgi:signal transduction histidine kinase